MRVAVDATPLLGRRTGIGRYVDGLTRALAATHPEVEQVLTAFTVRGRGGLPQDGRGLVLARPFPARLAQAAWGHLPFPPAELVAGPHDVFHATNFVLPPSCSASGVVTVHDLAWLTHPETAAPRAVHLRRLVPRAVRRARVVLTPTRAVADQLVAELDVRAEVMVTPLGVDPEWFGTHDRPVAVPDLPRRYVLSVGTREPRKNLGTLLAAHTRATAQGECPPDLVLVGDPGWGAAERLASTGSVHVLGYVAEPVLRYLVAQAAAVAMPSLDEGFGLPVVEAFATGTHVLASDIPALREVSGGLARHVPTRDVDAWAQALLEVSNGAVDRAALRARAAEFTWARCAALTAQAYHRAGHAASGP